MPDDAPVTRIASSDLCMSFTDKDATVNAVHSQEPDSRLLRAAWGLAPTAMPGPRPRFTWRDIAGAALRVADAHGLPGVSLSAVASELGLTTTALYRYVDSKDALVELMTDAAVGPPPQFDDDDDWRAATEAWTRELWGRYLHHPWLSDVRTSGMPRHPQRLGWIDVLLRQLDRGCVSDPMNTALLLDAVARTFGLLARPPSGAVTPQAWLLDATAARYPRLARELDRDWTNIEDEFTEAVRTVLRGCRQHPADARPEP
jgi:AcrR family transcriptional regulator